MAGNIGISMKLLFTRYLHP